MDFYIDQCTGWHNKKRGNREEAILWQKEWPASALCMPERPMCLGLFMNLFRLYSKLIFSGLS